MGRCSCGGGGPFSRCKICVVGAFLYLVFPGPLDLGRGAWVFPFFVLFCIGMLAAGPWFCFVLGGLFWWGVLVPGHYYSKYRNVTFCAFALYMVFHFSFLFFFFSCPMDSCWLRGFFLSGVFVLFGTVFTNYRKNKTLKNTKTNLISHPCVFWIGIFPSSLVSGMLAPSFICFGGVLDMVCRVFLRLVFDGSYRLAS